MHRVRLAMLSVRGYFNSGWVGRWGSPTALGSPEGSCARVLAPCSVHWALGGGIIDRNRRSRAAVMMTLALAIFLELWEFSHCTWSLWIGDSRGCLQGSRGRSILT